MKNIRDNLGQLPLIGLAFLALAGIGTQIYKGHQRVEQLLQQAGSFPLEMTVGTATSGYAAEQIDPLKQPEYTRDMIAKIVEFNDTTITSLEQKEALLNYFLEHQGDKKENSHVYIVPADFNRLTGETYHTTNGITIVTGEHSISAFDYNQSTVKISYDPLQILIDNPKSAEDSGRNWWEQRCALVDFPKGHVLLEVTGTTKEDISRLFRGITEYTEFQEKAQEPTGLTNNEIKGLEAKALHGLQNNK